jgi:hypothetical protein
MKQDVKNLKIKTVTHGDVKQETKKKIEKM